MIDWEWVGFLGFICVIVITIITGSVFAFLKPTYDEKVAKITRPHYIAYCDNSVANGAIDGLKIKAWRGYEKVTVIYNMNGTKTTITAAGVCTFKEIR